MRREFRLPDVGEGLTEAEVLAWRVAPGDTVAVNDVLVEVESVARTATSDVEVRQRQGGLFEFRGERISRSSSVAGRSRSAASGRSVE